VKIIGLQKVLKLVSLRPDIQANMMLHFQGVAWQKGLQHFVGNVNGANRAGRHWISAAKYTLLPTFFFHW
jgi:hypothetical protein